MLELLSNTWDGSSTRINGCLLSPKITKAGEVTTSKSATLMVPSTIFKTVNAQKAPIESIAINELEIKVLFYIITSRQLH
jgi:hypothetical protein